MADKYVQNIHIAGIRCKTKDKTLDIVFPILSVDRVTGRQVHSGYTRLTEEQYAKLSEGSSLFKTAVEKWKKLLVYDEAPAEAMTPHEALAGSRKEAANYRLELERLKVENEELKAQLEKLASSAKQGRKKAAEDAA
jgi:hypothetical protein